MAGYEVGDVRAVSVHTDTKIHKIFIIFLQQKESSKYRQPHHTEFPFVENLIRKCA